MASELELFTKSIADALREKKKKTALINPQDFSSEIRGIKTEPNLQEKTATQNGDVVADAGFDGLSKVTVDVPQPSGTIEITANGTQNVKDYESANVNVQPNLTTKSITQNGTYNASADGVDGYSSVDVNLPIPDLSQTTATAGDVLEGKEFYNASGEKVTGTYKNMLQDKLNKTKSAKYLYSNYTGNGSDVLDLRNLDFSKVINMEYMFYYANNLKTINLSNLDLSAVTNMTSMFNYCYSTQLADLSNVKTGALTTMSEFCKNSGPITIDLSGMDTSTVTNMSKMFWANNKIEKVLGSLDMLNCTDVTSMFYLCEKLKTITIKNLKVSLGISNGSNFGLKWSADSLCNLFYECWDNTNNILGGDRALGIGNSGIPSAVASIYVKAVDINDTSLYINKDKPYNQVQNTDENAISIVDYATNIDTYLANKKPFVICQSTDEGAMLIADYVRNEKNWTFGSYSN